MNTCILRHVEILWPEPCGLMHKKYLAHTVGDMAVTYPHPARSNLYVLCPTPQVSYHRSTREATWWGHTGPTLYKEGTP